MGRRRRAFAVTTITAVAVTTAASPALAGGPDGTPDVKVVTRGLDGPRELQFIDRHRLVVAESDSGEVTQVKLKMGGKRTMVSGLVSPQGVDDVHGKLFIATGEAFGPPPPPGSAPTSLLKVRRWGGTPRVAEDLLQYELDFNPDQQVQFGPTGEPVDTLSNPYYVLGGRHSVLVADAGANAILKYDRHTGRTTTLAALPVVTGGVCDTWPNNPGTVGCDPVPTGIARHDGHLYVSTLGADAPGAGRVLKLDEKTGELLGSLDGFTGATGVAVGDDGSVYVSELFHGAPQGEGPPPPGFDPATIGRIIRVAPDGTRTSVPVTMPTGLVWGHGRLYASAWSVGVFFGIPHAGQIVSISPDAFH